MTDHEIIQRLRAATENEVLKALDGASVALPITTPYEALELYNRMIDLAIESGTMLRIPCALPPVSAAPTITAIDRKHAARSQDQFQPSFALVRMFAFRLPAKRTRDILDNENLATFVVAIVILSILAARQFWPARKLAKLRGNCHTHAEQCTLLAEHKVRLSQYTVGEA